MTAPSSIPRRTVARSAHRSGPSLLTGQKVTVTLRPTQAGEGIVFQHAPTGIVIPANLAHVADSPHCTALASGDARIDFVEHLLAVLSANGVTDAGVDVDGSEIPLLDGSAREYQAMVEEAGAVETTEDIEPAIVNEEVYVGRDGKSMVALPGGTQYWYLLDHAHPRLGRQAASFDPAADDFAKHVAPARTFSTEEEARALIEARGLEGADMDMSVIVFGDRLSAPEPFANSFAMHKVLDLIGDLYLLGRPLVARIIAYRTGHVENRALATRIAEQLA